MQLTWRLWPSWAVINDLTIPTQECPFLLTQKFGEESSVIHFPFSAQHVMSQLHAHADLVV
jgi:hypothetical protein